MTRLKKVYLLIGTLAALLVLIGVALDLQWLRLASKPFVILALMGWLWPAGSRYARWLMAGLAASIAGGILLELEGMFLPGLLAFLLAHLGYIGAYLSDSRQLALGRAWPFFLYGIGVYVYLWPGLGAMAIPVAIYILTICAMMWRAAARFDTPGISRRSAQLALGGAILFALSDTLIGSFVFREALPLLNYPILILYWIGQLGITASWEAN